jgi:hypothetical protein
MAKLSEQELKAIINKEITNSQSFLGGELSEQRQKSLEYYLGDKLGTEIDGRSQVVSTDVSDTIETILPNLLRIFTASDQVVKCEPVNSEDIKLADQVTNYINYIFYKDNPGFEILYTWFKDALLEKNGIVKIYWDDSQTIEQETYENLNQEEYALLMQSDNVELVSKEEFVDEKAVKEIQKLQAIAEQQGETLEVEVPKLCNAIIKRYSGFGKIKIENIPPEEFLIKSDAKSIEDSNFVAHKVYKTRSDLIQMGYDKDVVDSLVASKDEVYNSEELARFNGLADAPRDDATDSSTEEVEVYECYIKLDFDNDGISELRKVIVAGSNSYEVLENMPCDFNPFCSLTPIPMPHRFFGRSVSELVEDVQLVKSTVMRQLLDNMYLTNNNRVAVMDGMVNLDDLLTSRPGGIVRTKQPPQQVMFPMQSQAISQQAFPLLEYLDTVRESRTGVTRYSQGLDADSLNKTATGVNTLMSQTQMRMELIARIFSETGVKQLFRRIFELSVKYQDKERIINLNNEFVPVRPTEWKNRYNISITVGLGSGSKEQQLIIMNNVLEKQIQAWQLQGGREYPMVSLKNIYNSLAKIIENAGLKNVENYFTNPEVGMSMMTPPPPPPITPIEKIEMTRIDAENKRKQADLELQMKKLQSDNASNVLEFETKVKELELKYNTQLDAAKIKADADINKIIVSNASKAFNAAQQSTEQLEQEIGKANADGKEQVTKGSK